MARKKIDTPGAVAETLIILANLIRIGRLERRLTQAELAQRAGVSTRTVGSIERAEASVSVGNVLAVAAAAGVELLQSDQMKQLSRVVDSVTSLAPKRVRTTKDSLYGF